MIDGMRLLAIALLALPVAAQDAVLPPVEPFAGKSRSLALAPDHAWATPFEKSGLKRTPRYGDTLRWLKKLCDAAPELRLVKIGTSALGRPIVMVVAGDVGKKPTLFAQGGIHPGEVDGKDAGMMLLRDMTVLKKKRALLDKAALLFVPVLSVDGHEDFGPFKRVNQRGPLEMGWRTNAHNLNLNRDYAKLDTAGVRAAVTVILKHRPDLYFDIHVTDGADYQYDITWGYSGPHAHSPHIARWLKANLDPALTADLAAMGHVPGPLVFSADPSKGNRELTFGARFSNGYGDLRQLPSVLVENHSLKPFDQRVLGTYVLLESALKLLGEKGAGLRDAARKDRARRPKEIPLSWDAGTKRKVLFKGIVRKTEPSAVSGSEKVVWTGEAWEAEVELTVHDKPKVKVKPPAAFWIEPQWTEVLDRLAAHGIVMHKSTAPIRLDVSFDRVTSYELAKAPFEGRVRVTAEFERIKRTHVFPKGSLRVLTDQPLGRLAVALLDPRGPDSFFAWGFFPHCLQRTEYIENYVIEPLAEKMLADPAVKKAFDEALKDEAFRKDPAARRTWFYRRTEFFDPRWMVVPVAREG